MARFASNKNAFGYSERSGFKYKLSDMRKEWNGITVGSDEYEPKHPQLNPNRLVSDPQALRNPKPRVEFMSAKVEFPIFDLQTISYKEKLLLQSELGLVTVSTS